MTRSQPGKPPHSKHYFSSFVGFTNPITGTITCRGHCTWWPRVGKRCALGRSRKAKAAIDRILLAALDIDCGGEELQIIVEAELDNICCQHHRSVEVVDEVCFLIEAYRVKVLGWAWEQDAGAVAQTDAKIMNDEETSLVAELLMEDAELRAALEMCVALEEAEKTIDAESALSSGADDMTISPGDHASLSDGGPYDDVEHLTSAADLCTANDSGLSTIISIDCSERRVGCSVGRTGSQTASI